LQQQHPHQGNEINRQSWEAKSRMLLHDPTKAAAADWVDSLKLSEKASWLGTKMDLKDYTVQYD